MSLVYDWKQAGTTRRAHLVARLVRSDGGFVRANSSACGMVLLAAWMPESGAVRCGLCRRLAAQAVGRGDPMVTP